MLVDDVDVFVAACVVVMEDDAAVVVVTGVGAGIEEDFVVVDEDFFVEAPVVVAFFAFAVDADVVVCDVVVCEKTGIAITNRRTGATLRTQTIIPSQVL